MKKTIITVLVIVILIAGGILYFYRDAVRNVYNNTQQEVSEDIQDVQEDILDSAQEAKEDTAN
ncbi:MAG: hypothetical protein WC010_02840 [Candidatus Absconditabacterales bacterium]